MRPTNCLNCGSGLGAGYKFCATCGQKANTHRLSFHEIGHDALHYVTHADKGIFHLIKELARRPGKVPPVEIKNEELEMRNEKGNTEIDKYSLPRKLKMKN
jgi:hypothetical protein